MNENAPGGRWLRIEVNPTQLTTGPETQRSHHTVDESFHRVFANLPPGWRFKGLFLASREGQRRKPGWWYAQASGPSPDREDSQFGLTGEGRPGWNGMLTALDSLAVQLERINQRFDYDDV